MFFDKNKDIVDTLKLVGYDPGLIAKATDLVDDGVKDADVERLLAASLTGPDEATLVLNYIKKKTITAFRLRTVTALGFLVFFSGLFTLYARMSERFAWYDVFLALIWIALATVFILNLKAWLQTRQNGPALEVKIKHRQFQVSKDNRLRVERMLQENGYYQRGLADELSEGFATGNDKGTTDLLMQQFGLPLHEAVQLVQLTKKEFRSIYSENAIGFLVVAGITLLLSWFMWRFAALTTGSILTYLFILLMLGLCVFNYSKAQKIAV